MPERINKLQPNRTVHLRGFDSFAAAATVHSATEDAFKVSGTFRDPADFAVAVLYDADNFYEHPSIKYLPDFDFSGLKLEFDLHYSAGLQPIDSPRFNWIDWATLDCKLLDGDYRRITLWDYATLVSPSHPAASVTCLLQGSAAGSTRDSVTLWYQNLAFESAGKSYAEYAMFATDGKYHQVTVNGQVYDHTDTTTVGESSAQVAGQIISKVNLDPGCPVFATVGYANHVVRLTVKSTRAGADVFVSGTGGVATVLHLITADIAASQIAAQMNAADWIGAGAPYALIAEASGASLTVMPGRYTSVEVNGRTLRWLPPDEVKLMQDEHSPRYLPYPTVSGPRFAGLSAGDTVWVAGARYIIESIDSYTQITLTTPPATSPAAQFVAVRGGDDANFLTLNALTAPGSGISFNQTQYQLSGGSSDVTWRCAIDFTELGIDQLRQCWLTFAPSLVIGPYGAAEWEASFTNWTLAGDEDKRALKVAGPGSVRIEETDSACVYRHAPLHGVEATDWAVPAPLEMQGFYSRYFVRRATRAGSSVTVTYYCQFEHDIYIGTSLYVNYGAVSVQLDGGAADELDCAVDTGSPLTARRRVRTAVPPGKHVVTLTLKRDAHFYFDFLEAAVPSDFPDALPPRTGVSPAIDFDTDHGYKLPPARVLWIFDKLGYAGPMNHYLGVFWWNQRVRTDAVYSTATVDFTGPFSAGDSMVLLFNDTYLGKSVFPGDDENTIAQHFATFINGSFVGAWAEAKGGRVTITARSPAKVYNLVLTPFRLPASGSMLIDTTIAEGRNTDWIIEENNVSPLNRATVDWHADFFGECAARGRDVAASCSLELVSPPEGFAAKYPGDVSVVTDTIFGITKSIHCAAGGSRMIAFQKRVYRQLADLQAAAGLRPWVQFGEFLWWYFEAQHSVGGGMAFYDAETRAAALQTLGRELHIFNAQDDDPELNIEDAVFLRNRLRDHVAELAAEVRAHHPLARCEVLYAYDVNYPTRLYGGKHDLGGRLNRFVNLPVEWQLKETSGLDAMKVEGLAFSTGYRNLDLAREAINLFPDFGWPLDSVRYLVPVFGAATPWNRELALAREAGLAENNFWAFDHICLYNLDVPERPLDRRSVVKAA